nr:hypothetical protein [Tanacetum cinerariifolium]
MERGFLDSGDKKKKKEGVSSTPSDEFPVLSGIAKNVKNIEGKTNVPKSILKKAVCNIVNDTHEVVKPSHDRGSASKVSFEAVGASAKSSTTVDDPTNFSPKSGRDQVIDKGQWMIRKSPIMLSKWSPSVSLKKGVKSLTWAQDIGFRPGLVIGANFENDLTLRTVFRIFKVLSFSELTKVDQG